MSKVAGGGVVAGSGTSTGTTPGSTSSTGTTTTTAASNAMDLNVLNYALTLEFLEASFYTHFLGNGAIPSGVTSLNGLMGTVTDSADPFVSTDLGAATVFSGLPTTFGGNLYSLLTQIRNREVAHVAALIQVITMLRGTPVQPCTFTFSVANINDFLKTAQLLENTGVSAYDGAINKITNPTLIQTGRDHRHCGSSLRGLLAFDCRRRVGDGDVCLPERAQPEAPGPRPARAPGSATVAGVSFSPFPSAFDTPLDMAAVVAMITPLQVSCIGKHDDCGVVHPSGIQHHAVYRRAGND